MIQGWSARLVNSRAVQLYAVPDAVEARRATASERYVIQVLRQTGYSDAAKCGSAQATLLRTLRIDTPRSITFNEISALRRYADTVTWPALLKPDQGGSGARIQAVVGSASLKRAPEVVLSALAVPPCASAASRTMARPRPAPGFERAAAER